MKEPLFTGTHINYRNMVKRLKRTCNRLRATYRVQELQLGQQELTLFVQP
jgi:hypothetical protein